ncbi:hypothetical protein TNCT_440361 [Trichonephila clavata]|uniref:Uncharacterized protein n=1 Tax=Trichonephila clavata TaxID=2740835 RepID=A0A8X6FHB1_TRICU|nr:hypothetical protein TNCT_440361 [Trichonephila clavata]
MEEEGQRRRESLRPRSASRQRRLKSPRGRSASRQRPDVEEQPQGEDVQRPAVEEQPQGEDVQRPAVEEQPQGEDVQRPAVEEQPQGEDVQRPAVEEQPQGEDVQRPAVEEQPKMRCTAPDCGRTAQGEDVQRPAVEEQPKMRMYSAAVEEQPQDEVVQRPALEEQRPVVRPWDVHYFLYTWLNKAFIVPPTPQNPRTFYPWSSSLALEYRAKLAIVLMNFVAAFFLAEKPCDRFGVLFNCSAAYLLCDFLYRNYPWRQPLKNHVWSLLCFWPTAQPLFYLIILPVVFKILKETCTLSTMSLCFLAVWIIIVTARFLRDDSCTEMSSELERERPVTINYSSYIEHCILLIITSIFYPAFYSAGLYAFWGLLFFNALQYDMFIEKGVQFVIFGFFVICGLKMVLVYMNAICEEAIQEWENKEMEYSKKVILKLREVLGNLPQAPGSVYDKLALDVPFLQQEARILQNAKYVDKEIKDELKYMVNEQKIVEFRESLHDYKPYSKECCIS